MTNIRILDGGMSRELVRLGAELRQPEWSALALIENPAIVQKVHEEFIDAGAQVITTNSYALVPYHIGEQRFQSEGARLLALSGQLARQAADQKADKGVLVAGCLPPVFGSYRPELFDADKVQAILGVFVKALTPYVDLWLGETLSLIAEGDAVRAATRNTGKPFWVSFTLKDEPGAEQETPQLRSGESVSDAARWAMDSKAKALLFNCSQPEVMANAVKAARTVIDDMGAELEVGVYANAFVMHGDEGNANKTLRNIRGDLTAEAYNGFACEWAHAGATIIGGCCGVGAHHIGRIYQAFERS